MPLVLFRSTQKNTGKSCLDVLTAADMEPREIKNFLKSQSTTNKTMSICCSCCLFDVSVTPQHRWGWGLELFGCCGHDKDTPWAALRAQWRFQGWLQLWCGQGPSPALPLSPSPWLCRSSVEQKFGPKLGGGKTQPPKCIFDPLISSNKRKC